jgi:tRNA nucleotidyltransferase (CCA-adding enzyme)
VRRIALAKLLLALPAGARPLVEGVLAEAERRGAAVHLVGGPVRDYLLGRPLRDVDLLVEAGEGAGAAELARAAAPPGARVVVHERFGTAHVEHGDAHLDLAGARSESYPRPGALPEVRAGSLHEDLLRRDFTVNALAIPLSAAAREGRPAVVDHATGVADLEAGVLRVLHRRSFHDDPTRALRAARLAPRLGFRLARSSGSALRAALRDGAFGGVSGERFRAELGRLFEDAGLGLDPARALRLLDDWHTLGALEPGLGLPGSAVAPLRRLGRALAEPPFQPQGAHPLVCGLMLWLAPAPAALRRRTLRRLALDGGPARAIAGFAERRGALLRALGGARGRGAWDAALAPLDPEHLLALYAAAPPAARRGVLRWAREDRAVSLPLRGDDLVALGLRGAAVGAALARLRAAWLDREARDPDELFALAQEVAKRGRVAHTRPASPRTKRSSAE